LPPLPSGIRKRTGGHSLTCSPYVQGIGPIPAVWDVIRVPFPYTDRPVRQRRPALVIAVLGMQAQLRLLWVLMITSAENRGWPGDVALADLPATGLPAPSLVRTEKVASVDARDAD